MSYDDLDNSTVVAEVAKLYSNESPNCLKLKMTVGADDIPTFMLRNCPGYG